MDDLQMHEMSKNVRNKSSLSSDFSAALSLCKYTEPTIKMRLFVQHK